MTTKIYTSLGLIAVIILLASLFVFKEKKPLFSMEAQHLEVLQECAKHNTQQLKTFTVNNIKKLEEFCLSSLQPNVGFPLFLFSYKPSRVPWSKGTWTATLLRPPLMPQYSCKFLLDWLNKNYHTNKVFQFYYYAQEPCLEGRFQTPDFHLKFADVVKNCPVLIPCNHPGFPWSYNCILIPDPYLLEKHAEFASLLDSKELLPFQKRKSKFFFSGSITAPNVPYTRENMQYNPRHGLLKKTNEWPFLEYNVTNFDFLNYSSLSSTDYKNYILKNYSHLKSESVDFYKHAEYRYLLCFDGFGAAWSRVPLILATGSVLILNALCHQYFYCLMIENETYIKIKQDLSNGEQLYRDLEKNPEKAEKIGKQGKNFARAFLNEGAVNSYLWLTIKEIENKYQLA